METEEPLARSTLDTLPFNVAVLDPDGTILFTNAAWREFGGREGIDAEDGTTGANYFEGADPEGDAYAKRAMTGIRAVIDGEEDLFTLEYPCHSPDQKRWFMMRVAPLAGDEERRVAVVHIDITERKLAELTAQRRAEELAVEREHLVHLLDRVNGLVRNVATAVLEADSRSDVEAVVCEEFATVDSYAFAWIGRTGLGDDAITPVAWAGAGDLQPDASLPLESADDPTVEAVRTGELVTRDGIPPSTVHASIRPDDAGLAAIPLTYNEAFYGVLHLYTPLSDAFDERERAVLEALGAAVSTAINAVESRRMLTADDVVEMEVNVTDERVYPAGLSTETGCRLEYNGAVTGSDGGVLQFFTAEGGDPDAIPDAVAERADVARAAELASFDGAARYEFAVDDGLVPLLADYGADVVGIEAADGVAAFTLEVPAEGEARALFDRLDERFDGVSLEAYRERERPATTRREFVEDLRAQLTDRQLAALQKAYVSGFFDWPRSTSGEELAESMDISPSTYHQHLRIAERKLLTSVFDQ